MQKYRRYRRSSQLLVWALVAILILLSFSLSQPEVLVLSMASPFMWLDENLWSFCLVVMTVFLLVFWISAAFSLLALATLACSVLALSLLFSGVGLMWPLILMMLAIWGFNKAMQQQ